MTAFKVPFKIDKGSTLDETFTWKAGTPAVPVDLTGCTARMQVRSEIDSPIVLLELTTENGGIELGGTAGTIRRRMTASATAALTWDSGVYDMEIVFANGTVQRKLKGPASVSPEVTR